MTVLLSGFDGVSALADDPSWNMRISPSQPDMVTLRAAFMQASMDYDVPVEILEAVAFAESRWVQAGPTIDGGYGIMHLVDNRLSGCHTLQEAAEVSGETVDQIIADAVANIRAGAALIARYATEGGGNPIRIADYRQALKRFTGLRDLPADKQIQEYYRILRDGARATNGLGIEIELPAVPEARDIEIASTASTLVPESIASTDYPPAIWIPAATTNYTVGRQGAAISYWVNHWTAGAYSSAISGFQTPGAYVSAHFVIRNSDGELTQMVRIADTAYHAGNWTYNIESIGIEHEGSHAIPWPTNADAPMLVNSTTCCRYFCDLYGIPKTRAYIIGHTEVPGIDRDCPGPIPWDLYMAMVVNTVPFFAPHPVAQYVTAGATTTFHVEVGGATPVVFQWQKDGVNLVDGGKASGTTTKTLQITNCQTAEQGNYRCVATNSHGSTTSNEAMLAIGLGTVVYMVESRSGGQNYSQYSETGGWGSSSSNSLAEGHTPNIGHRYCTIDGNAKTAVFKFTPMVTANYEIFTTNLGTANSGSPLMHIVTHAGGSTIVPVCQNRSCSPLTPCDTWLSLGQYVLNAGTMYSVTLNGSTAAGSGPSGNAGRSDAIKWIILGTGTATSPSITQQPSDQTVAAGGAASFTVGVGGATPFTYQWQKDGADLSTGGNITGATSATLQITNCQTTDQANYRCVVTNAYGSVTSNTATLTVASGIAPTITQQPSNQTVTAGATATFTIAAAGTTPLTYQWQKSSVNISDGGNMSGATTATLQISNCQITDQGDYRCLVTNKYGNATSNAAGLTVTSPIAITYIVESRSGGYNYANYYETGIWYNSTCKNTASEGTSGIGSRWCTISSTAGTAVFQFTPIVGGNYEVFTTNCNTDNSGNPLIHKVSHSGGTAIIGVCQNSSCTKNAINKWYSLGQYVLNAGTTYNVTLDASTGAGSLPAGNAARSDAIKWYTAGGSGTAPGITQQPANQTVTAGGTVTFTVIANGDAPVAYQWQKNGVNISDGGNMSGATTATLQISNCQTADQGDYRCVVTNTYGSATSNAASLTIATCTPGVLQNGDFEGGNTNGVGSNWVGYQRTPNPSTAWSIQTASPPTGGGLQYQQIANTSSTGGGGVRQDVTGCTVGATYTISGWMRTNSAYATCTVKCSPTASTSWSTAVDLTPPQTTTSNSWVPFSGTVTATGTSMTIWLDGQTGGTGLNKAACFDSVTVTGCSTVVAPTITAAVSNKVHGSAGGFNINILAANAVECRKNGPTQVVVTFDQAIQQVSGTVGDVTLSSGTVSSLAINGSQLTIAMSGAMDVSLLTIGFSGIVNTSGLAPSDSLCFGVLAGDANGDRKVNVFDLQAVKSAVNQPVTTSTFRDDVTSDGGINVFDLLAVKNNLNRIISVSCP